MLSWRWVETQLPGFSQAWLRVIRQLSTPAACCPEGGTFSVLNTCACPVKKTMLLLRSRMSCGNFPWHLHLEQQGEQKGAMLLGRRSQGTKGQLKERDEVMRFVFWATSGWHKLGQRSAFFGCSSLPLGNCQIKDANESCDHLPSDIHWL